MTTRYENNDRNKNEHRKRLSIFVKKKHNSLFPKHQSNQNRSRSRSRSRNRSKPKPKHKKREHRSHSHPNDVLGVFGLSPLTTYFVHKKKH